jgi:hypothetical protein
MMADGIGALGREDAIVTRDIAELVALAIARDDDAASPAGTLT